MAMELFAVSVRGPDDLIATRDYQEAVLLSNLLNDTFQHFALQPDFNPQMHPLMWALPIVYPFEPEAYERGLTTPGEYADALRIARRLRDFLAEPTRAGDGNFKWWWATAEDSELWNGPHATKEEAIASGLVEARADGELSFVVGDADKSVARPLIHADNLAERVLEDLAELNVECWGEDGYDDTWSDKDRQALERALTAAVTNWLAAHPADTWTLNGWRSCDVVDVATGEAKPLT